MNVPGVVVCEGCGLGCCSEYGQLVDVHDHEGCSVSDISASRWPPDGDSLGKNVNFRATDGSPDSRRRNFIGRLKSSAGCSVFCDRFSTAHFLCVL
jgi:hypothetical protein